MPDARRQFLIGLVMLLGGGALLGWIYGRPDWGFLIAAIVALLWQVRQMFAFEQALRSGNFDDVRYGGGFWAQAFSRFDRLRRRSVKHKKRYRRLLKEVRKSTNAMPDGGIILDDRFEIVSCNAAAQALVGFDPREDRGQRVDNLLRGPAFGAYLHSSDYEEGIEIPSPISDGEWLHCRIVPYGEDQRLLLIRNVTDRIRLNKMRRDFVANASHEMRSPLTVISGYLDALASDPAAPEEWKRPLSQMQIQAARMTSIVAELIELSRLETSGSAPQDGDVDVCGLIARVAKSYSGQKGAATIRVECSNDAHLRGSASDIESVITNLVSNAIRHTPADGTITVSWSQSDDGASLVVSDTGEGIVHEDIPRLTERFFRVDRGRSRDEGGVGLGLSIVKYALNRHQAELNIQSEVGKGSAFTCQFPPERLMAPPTYSTAANN